MGDENRSEWRIDDGLCPGTEGGCSMMVPVALGVEMSVDADVLCAHPERDSEGRLVTSCNLADFSVDVGGAGQLRSESGDASEGRLDLRVYTAATGDVSFDLRRGGAQYDRTSMRVREATGIECGRVGADGASWDMHSLLLQSSYTVEYYGAEAEPDVELGCRLSDAGGAPLFSAAAIEWRIIEGADLATVDDGGLFGGDSSTGARVYVRFTRTGTIRLEARFGALTQQVELVVR